MALLEIDLVKQTETSKAARPSTGWSRRGRVLLALVLLLALALRLWYLQVNTLQPQYSNADDGDYYQRAMRLAITGSYVDDSWLIRPPLHVFIFAGLLRIGLMLGGPADGVLLIQLLQVVLGAMQAGLAADLARRLWRSERAGLLLGAALAVFWPLVEAPAGLFSEPIFLFLWTLHFWLLARFDSSGRRLTLIASGLALGLSALTRSPALYALAFSAPWLWLRARSMGLSSRQALGRGACQLLVLGAATLAVVLPWTIRNYLVYQRVILVDTLGPINLWLDLGETAERNPKIETLRRMPQADRQAYASAQVRAILREDPARLFHSAWPNFRHVWKAQFVEDFIVKRSFFARPLRSVWGLGLLGDTLWLAMVLGAVAGALRPALSERWRLLLLLWLLYSLATVLIFHVEPRYLLPLWMVAALLAAGPWATPLATLRELRTRPLRAAAGAALVVALLILIVSYRDYPSFLASMWARERAWTSAEAAYAQGNYAAAERDYRRALEAAPHHEDVRLELALALSAMGHVEEAWSLMEGAVTRRGRAVQAYLMLRRGDREQALSLWNDLHNVASEDLQAWMLRALPPMAQTWLDIGSGEEMGAIAGFAAGERSEGRTFRWSGEDARVILRLPAPLQPGAVLLLDLGTAADQPEAQTPVMVTINGRQLRFEAEAGWRRYSLALPPALTGSEMLEIEIDAPIFVPRHHNPQSNDHRGLGVMVDAIAVEQ